MQVKISKKSNKNMQCEVPAEPVWDWIVADVSGRQPGTKEGRRRAHVFSKL